MLKRRLQRLVRVYTCQNATLLESSCTGSYHTTEFSLLGLDIPHKLVDNKTWYCHLFHKCLFVTCGTCH